MEDFKTLAKGLGGMLLTNISHLTLEDVDNILSICSTVAIFGFTVFKILKRNKNKDVDNN